jgi:hypothetical protein
MVSVTEDISSVTARLHESIECGSYCSFAYSALACFTRDVTVAVC